MKLKKFTKLSAILAAAAMATACGGQADSAATNNNAEEGATEEITIGLMQIGAAVPIEYGIQEGIFEDHGLDVEYNFARGGSVMVPAVETGEYDFAITNPLTIMQANDVGMDMRILSGFAHALPEGDDVHAVVARVDSGITSFADLADREVAINTLETQGDLSIMAAAEQHGADPESIHFSEIAFPDMEPQLEIGNVEAVWLPEPLLSQALQDSENTLVGYPAQESIPGMPMLSTFTSAEYAEQNPEIVDRFIAAIDEVLTESTANEDDARDLLPDFMGLPLEATDGMRLEEWSSETREELVDQVGELAVQFDVLDAAPKDLYLDK